MNGQKDCETSFFRRSSDLKVYFFFEIDDAVSRETGVSCRRKTFASSATFTNALESNICESVSITDLPSLLIVTVFFSFLT